MSFAAGSNLPPPGNWRLLLPALVLWAVCAGLVHLPKFALPLLLAALLVGATALLVRVRSSKTSRRARWEKANQLLRRSGGILLLASALLMVLSARIITLEVARDPPLIRAAAAAHSEITAQITLTGYPRLSDGFGGAKRAALRGEITALSDTKLAQAVPVLLWLNSAPPPAWGPGTTIAASGTVQQATRLSREAYTMRVRESSAPAREGLAVFNPLALLNLSAAKLRHSLREAAAVVPAGQLVPGLAVGDTALIDDHLQQLMLESSLTHLVAVSGSNCALVIGAAIWLVSWLGGGRKTRIIAAAVALVLFMLLVGPDASIQRAAVMAAVLLLANFGGRPSAGLPALGLAIVVLLIADPWQAMQAGFALSVTATGGILLGAAPLNRLLQQRLKLPRFLALPLAVAAIAQFACAPLLLLLQPGLPVGGVVANLLAAPAAPLGTGLGMLAMLAIPLHAASGQALIWLAALAARWITASAELATSLPAATWFWPGGVAGSLLLTLVWALLVAWAIMRSAKNVKYVPWVGALPPSFRQRLLRNTLAMSSAAILCAVVIVVPSAVRLGTPHNWLIVACDIGQGDALLLRDPAQKEQVMLIDTGDDPKKLRACLQLFGVRKISLLVLTHDDADHIGALDEVLSETAQVLVSPPSREHQRQRPLTAHLSATKVPYLIGHAGMRGGAQKASAGLRWQIIGPNPRVHNPDTNGSSLVLQLSVAGISVLLLADTGASEQQWLLAQYPKLRADIVKVAHHGSKDQASGFYERLRAQVLLLSAGENRYGHPHPHLLRQLRQSGGTVLRTDLQGSVAVSVEKNKKLVAWQAGRHGAEASFALSG